MAHVPQWVVCLIESSKRIAVIATDAFTLFRHCSSISEVGGIGRSGARKCLMLVSSDVEYGYL